jgi:2'-hydroxyisoflavone reductase
MPNCTLEIRNLWEKTMDVLVVGGTGFLGGAVVDAARTAGHAVSIFTRGRTKRQADPLVETLVGDRFGDLSGLRDRRFDLVVDTCAFTPDAVADLLDALSPATGRYAFVSSISVYAGLSKPNMDETAPTSRATSEQLAMARALPTEQRSSAASYGSAYGALKREAELVALSHLGDRALILRAGLLVGAGDYTDRLTYWVRRIDRGGTIPLPGDPDRLVQLIDVRDAAAFIVAAGEQDVSGIFNLTGRPVSMAAIFETCRELTGSNARFVWRPEAEILAAGLAPWSEVPLWLPTSDAALRYLLEVSTDKAFAAGLKTRPLQDTLRNILDWDRSRRATPLKAGMPPEKEARLLASET